MNVKCVCVGVVIGSGIINSSGGSGIGLVAGIIVVVLYLVVVALEIFGCRSVF